MSKYLISSALTTYGDRARHGRNPALLLDRLQRAWQQGRNDYPRLESNRWGRDGTLGRSCAAQVGLCREGNSYGGSSTLSGGDLGHDNPNDPLYLAPMSLPERFPDRFLTVCDGIEASST